MNNYALYLDDMRYPPQTGDSWVLCRTVATMLDILNERGVPSLASFDYELGHTDPGNTGGDAVIAFLNYLISNPQAGEAIDLDVRLHTSSGAGKAHMAQLLKQSQGLCEEAGVRLKHRYCGS